MRFFLLLAVLIVISCKPDASSKTTDGGTNEQQDAQKTNVVDKKSPNSTAPTASNQSDLSTKKNSTKNSKVSTRSRVNKAGIPDACDLLTTKTIGRYVRQSADIIFAADGSNSQNPKARACFFKWDGSAIANAGVMVQLQQNPVQEDVPEYFTYLITSKKTEGDKDPMSDGVLKYKDWPGFGDDGAYSTDAGKYVWRVGNEWAFMIAFNTELAPKAQKVAAEAFAQEVMSRMQF